MMGREFQSLGILKKYELRVMLLMETHDDHDVEITCIANDVKPLSYIS